MDIGLFLQFLPEQQWEMTTDSSGEKHNLIIPQRHSKGPFVKEGVNAFSTIWQLMLSWWPKDRVNIRNCVPCYRFKGGREVFKSVGEHSLGQIKKIKCLLKTVLKICILLTRNVTSATVFKYYYFCWRISFESSPKFQILQPCCNSVVFSCTAGSSFYLTLLDFSITYMQNLLCFLSNATSEAKSSEAFLLQRRETAVRVQPTCFRSAASWLPFWVLVKGRRPRLLAMRTLCSLS